MPVLYATPPRTRPLGPPPGRAPEEPCPRCGAIDWSRFGPRWLCHACWTLGVNVSPDGEPRRSGPRGPVRRPALRTQSDRQVRDHIVSRGAPAPVEEESPMSTVATPPALPRLPELLSEAERQRFARKYGTPDHFTDPNPPPGVPPRGFWTYRPTAAEIAADDAERDLQQRIAEVNRLFDEASRREAFESHRERRPAKPIRAAWRGLLLHRLAPTRYALPAAAYEWADFRLLELARKDAELRDDLETFSLPPAALARRALQRGWRGWTRSAPQSFQTTSDFAGLLAAVLAQVFVDTFTSAARTYEPWTRSVTVSSFAPTVVATAQFPRLAEVSEHGEIPRGLPPGATAALKLREFARTVALTRQAILNDDVGWIAGLIASLAGAAAACEADVAYAALLDNPVLGDGQPLFSAAHKNLAPASAVTAAALTAATALLTAQTAPTGEPLHLLPAFLLVGPALAAEARTLLAAQTPPTGGETAAVPQLVVEPRIADGRWYLTCDPARWPTVVVAHLTDQAEPVLDDRDGWDLDGREFRARLDVAAVAGDFRGLVLTPAAA